MNNFYHFTAQVAREKYLKFRSRLEKSISNGRFETFSRKKKNQLVARLERKKLQISKVELLLKGASFATAAAFATESTFANKSDAVRIEKSSASDIEHDLIEKLRVDSSHKDFEWVSGEMDFERLAAPGVPATISFYTDEFSERVANAGNKIGSLVAFTSEEDRLSNDGLTYTFVAGNGTNDADNSLFAIVNVNEITLAGATSVDYDVKNIFRVRVQVTDGVNTATKALTLKMQDSPDGGKGTFERTGENWNARIDAGVIEDIDGDGDVDFLYRRWGSLYYNDEVAAGGEYVGYASYIDTPSGGEYNVYVYDYRDFLLHDIDGDGDKDLIVAGYGDIKIYNFDAGTFSYDASIPISGASTAPSLNQGVTDIAVGDVDGDGTLEIFAIRDGYVNIVSDGGEGLAVNEVLYADAYMASIDVGDIDGDADADIVFGVGSQGFYGLTNEGSYIGAMINYGGEWSNQYITSSGGNVDLVLQDFDNDGDLDLLSVGTSSYSKYRGGVLLDNDGAGNFSFRGGLFTYLGNPLDEHATGVLDVDGDGDLDVGRGGGFFRANALVVDSFDQEYGLEIDPYNKYYLFSESFDEIFNYSGSAYSKYRSFAYDRIETIIPGDIDGDGRMEAIISWQHDYNTYTYIFENRNIAPEIPEGFAFPKSKSFVHSENDTENEIFGSFYAFDRNKDEVAVSFFEGDNDNDLFSIEITDEGGEYSTSFDILADEKIDSEASEDLQVQFEISDGNKSRVIDFNPKFLNLTEGGKGTISEKGVRLFGTSRVGSVIIGDSDVDGDQDILIGGESGGIVIGRDATLDSRYPNSLFKQISNGVFVENAIKEYSYSFQGGVFHDLDNDGDLDLIAHGKYGGEICCVDKEATKASPNDRIFFLRNNDGEFQRSKYFESLSGFGNGIEKVATGDFDGDGTIDLAVLTSDNEIRVMGGEENFNLGLDFGTSLTISGIGSTEMAVGDLDGDGKDDIISVSRYGAEYVIMGHEFIGSMASSYIFDVGGGEGGEQRAEIADLDGDGDLDIAISDYEYGIYLYLGNGSGAFTYDSKLGGDGSEGGTYTISAKIGDLDGDGDADIVRLSYDDPEGEEYLKLNMYLNNGSGSFELTQSFEIDGFSYGGESLNLADVDNDDDLDVLVAVFGSDATGLTVFKNQNVAPSAIQLDETSFDENLTIATQVATVTVDDPNVNDTHTLFMSAGDGTNDVDNSKFVIDGDKLLILESPDFESQAEYKINIKAIDDDFGSLTQAFTLTVNDIEPEASGLEDNKSLSLYPNPGSERIQVSLDHKVTGDVSIKVSDISGRLIHVYEDTKRYDKWSKTIPMSSQEPGIYIVEIQVGDQSFKQRWIKKD